MFTTLIQKVIIGIMGAALIALGYYSIKQYFVNSSLEDENKYLNTAVVEYESIIKVLPFNVLTSERKDKANEDINATYNNIHIITGTKRM